MAGKTISAYTNEQTADRIRYIAKAEHRKPAAVAGMALELFAELPTEARSSWSEIQTLGTSEDIEEVKRDITRALLNIKYKVAQREVLKQMEVDDLEPLETEDDILAATIHLTR
jgi:hypothetical protein